MKRSREYRFHQKEKLIKKRMRLVKDTFPDMIDTYEKKLNYLAAHDPFDCGRANCGRCRSPEKYHRGQIQIKESVTKDYEDNDDE